MASTLRLPGKAAELAVLAGAIGVSLIAWAWLWHMGSASAPYAAWTTTDAALTFAMWAVMMVAMMAGPVAPALMLFAGMQRTRDRGSAVPMFACGYALAWVGFSAAATLAQWLLDRATMLTPDMALANARVGGAILVIAGVYAFTPLSTACLRNCQSPREVREISMFDASACGAASSRRPSMTASPGCRRMAIWRGSQASAARSRAKVCRPQSSARPARTKVRKGLIGAASRCACLDGQSGALAA